MPSPNEIIEPRDLLYEWETIKLLDKDGNIIQLTVIESNDEWLIVEAKWKSIHFPRAFFVKNNDWSYSPYILSP